MFRRFAVILVLLAWCLIVQAIAERHGFLVGEVLKLNTAAKTVVIKAADGTEHTLHFLGRTAVHGAKDTAAGAKDAFRGLKEGSCVALTTQPKAARRLRRRLIISGRMG